MEPIPDAVDALLKRPNPAVIATVRRDGAPVSAAVWYLWDGQEVTVVMGAASPRRRQLDRDGRFTLTVLDADSWYRQVTLHCAVTELSDDLGLAAADRLSQHYDGRPFGDRAGAHAVARARPTGWNAFGVA